MREANSTFRVLPTPHPRVVGSIGPAVEVLVAMGLSPPLHTYQSGGRRDTTASQILAAMVTNLSTCSGIFTPRPGEVGTRTISASARKAGSVVPLSARYCGPLSAAGVLSPAHANRWADAASDRSGS